MGLTLSIYHHLQYYNITHTYIFIILYITLYNVSSVHIIITRKVGYIITYITIHHTLFRYLYQYQHSIYIYLENYNNVFCRTALTISFVITALIVWSHLRESCYVFLLFVQQHVEKIRFCHG